MKAATVKEKRPAEVISDAGEAPGKAVPNRIKPRLRGWQHLVMTPIFLLAGLVLVVFSPDWPARACAAIYLLSGLLLFGTSAAYHLGHWPVGAARRLRRLDHSNIFLFIAGSYTPLTMASLSSTDRVWLLSLVWCSAIAGVVMKVFWMSAPRWLYTIIYVVMGWAAMGWLGDFWQSGGPAVVWLMISGGLCYTIGALCYALKRPNPIPGWYEFHEIMHSGTILGATCHYIAIVLAVF